MLARVFSVPISFCRGARGCVIGLLGKSSVYEAPPVVNLFYIKNLRYDHQLAVNGLKPLLNAVLPQLLRLQTEQSSKRKARIAASAGA